MADQSFKQHWNLIYYLILICPLNHYIRLDRIPLDIWVDGQWTVLHNLCLTGNPV